MLVAYVSVQGRSLVEWAPVVGHWWWRKARSGSTVIGLFGVFGVEPARGVSLTG